MHNLCVFCLFQLQKIETESAVKEEIEELEEMLANASLVT